MNTPIEDYLEVSQLAAKRGGKVLMEWLGRIQAREKAPRDLVTEADLASQQAIQKVVQKAFPNHQFLGEEDDPGARGRPDKETPCWIVDPLDGTTNFVHQLPNFSVSVALARAGQVLVGAVYDPFLEECFTAKLGGGAFLNGAPVAASEVRNLSEALVAFSFSANVDRQSSEVEHFLDMLGSCQALRRLGSAALNLCYLAAGRLDGYWATSVKPWDVAAGALLVTEAGGRLTDLDNSRFKLMEPRLVAAATPELHREMVSRLRIT